VRRLFFLPALVLTSGSVSAQSAEDLQRLIRERDAEIERLNRRIDALQKTAAQPPEDEAETNRALERALVQQGGLLLDRGVYELEPQLVYSHWDKTRSDLRDVVEPALAVRIGVGWQSQLQVRIPYVFASAAGDSGSGFGDLELALSHQLRREGEALPSLVASLGWLSRTGRDPFSSRGVATGGGFNVLQAGLLALKRSDPLVYYGGASYSAPQARELSGARLEPSDSLGLRLGAILAASPSASVSAGMNLSFVGTARVEGERIPDSDTVLGTFQLGFGTVLSRRVVLNVAGEMRLSGAVPDLRLGITLPVRF
jgi:hypothetical protein